MNDRTMTMVVAVMMGFTEMDMAQQIEEATSSWGRTVPAPHHHVPFVASGIPAIKAMAFGRLRQTFYRPIYLLMENSDIACSKA